MTRIDLSSAIKVAVFENGFPRVVPILPKPGTPPKGWGAEWSKDNLRCWQGLEVL